MDKLAGVNNRLNRIIKVIGQPGIDLDQAKDLYNESIILLKNVEELKGDTTYQLSAKEKTIFADIKQKEHKLHFTYSQLINERARELEQKRLQDTKRILMLATSVASLALVIMVVKLFLK